MLFVLYCTPILKSQGRNGFLFYSLLIQQTVYIESTTWDQYITDICFVTSHKRVFVKLIYTCIGITDTTISIQYYRKCVKFFYELNEHSSHSLFMQILFVLLEYYFCVGR